MTANKEMDDLNDHSFHPQSRPPATNSGGFSPRRLARMHAALRRHVERGMLPGLVAVVSQRGREHVEVIGTEAFGSSVPIRRDTIFRLASMTKPITAVGAMILVEECRIRLDDLVEEWLPEVQDRRVLRTIESPQRDQIIQEIRNEIQTRRVSHENRNPKATED